jgi:quercetin dioxygenase-like cupin family protein
MAGERLAQAASRKRGLTDFTLDEAVQTRGLFLMKVSMGVALIVLSLCLSRTVAAVEKNTAVKVTPLLRTTSSWDGRQIVYPEGQAEITALVVEIAPGGETGWHQHPVPSFGILLEGILEVTLKDGRTKRMEAGDVLAEVVDTVHSGRAVGNTPAKIVVFYTGAVGKPLTVTQP